ncbi:hypothetical protein ACFL2R_00465 [Patescibacteria group bacterium]
MKRRIGESDQRLRFLSMLVNDIFAAMQKNKITDEELSYIKGELRKKLLAGEDACRMETDSFWVGSADATSVISVLHKELNIVDENLNVWKRLLKNSKAAGYVSRIFLDKLACLQDFNDFLIIDGFNEELTDLIITGLGDNNQGGVSSSSDRICVVLAFINQEVVDMILEKDVNPSKLTIFTLFNDTEEIFNLDIRSGIGVWHIVDFFYKKRGGVK